MKYSKDEKAIAERFIKCKIPECIKLNEFTLEYDTMECYEALFDYAYCILNDRDLSSNFDKSLSSDKFSRLLKKMIEINQNEDFCSSALNLLNVCEDYKNK